MKCAGWVSSKMGFMSVDENKSLTNTIDKLSLPHVSKVDPNTILSYVKKDKKMRNGILHFVVLNTLGEGTTCDSVPDNLIKDSLKVIQ